MGDLVGLVIAFFVGYAIGWIRNLWQLQKAFPDLYAELKRRCKR